jgi:hypothetical protein
MEAPGTASAEAAAAAAAKPLTPEEEALRRNTDCVYFLASPLTCKKVIPRCRLLCVPFKLVCFSGVVVYAIRARNFVQMIWLGQVASLFLKGNCGGSMLIDFLVRRNSQGRKQASMNAHSDLLLYTL